MTVPRHPNDLMRLSRIGTMFPTRLSFLRTLLRNLAAERSQLRRPVWVMDDAGFGHAVYSIDLGGHTYSLFAITQPLDPSQRTDRVIAEAWDAAFVLYDGVPDAGEIQRLSTNAPLQESGRFTERDLCLSRANKSMRLFAGVVDALRGAAPLPLAQIKDIGYLMRTTAVYGNGKFGIADRFEIADRPGMGGPFMAEMLTVWMIRSFTHDLVEHVGGAELPRKVKKNLGIGNSTGLGMAPFLVSHPMLLHSWVMARETALARVLGADVGPDAAAHLIRLSRQISQHLLEWNVPDDIQQACILDLRQNWLRLSRRVSVDSLQQKGALKALFDAAPTPEMQELLVSWMLEVFPDQVDELETCLANPNHPQLDGAQTVGELLEFIQSDGAWALDVDFEDSDNMARFWYVSEAKLEPRLGWRFQEDGGELESPLNIARRISDMARDLQAAGAGDPLWAFLMTHPQHRFAAVRVQTMMALPYAEIRDNLTHANIRPIDMLRFKLAFFGAFKFDPKSDLWTRITLAQGAPLPDEIASGGGGDMGFFPVFGQ